MERHVGLFAAAVLLYVISLVEVEPGFVSPAIGLPAKVLRDAAAKKGESVPVTKDLMKARKALKDQDFLMQLDERVGSVNGNEYVMASTAIEMLAPMESTVFPKFWQFLAKKNRAGLMTPVMDHYLKSLYKAESIAPVRVTAATPLSDAEKEVLKEKLKRITGASDVKMVVIVDTKFVAGFFLEYDFIDPDNMLDAQKSIDMTMSNHINLSALKKGVVGMG